MTPRRLPGPGTPPPLPGNATKTSAQRQAEYRARRATAGPDHNGERRLTVWVSTGAVLALARLARRYQVTQRAMLEQLITTADDDVLRNLDLDTPEFHAYLEGTTLPGNGRRTAATIITANDNHAKEVTHPPIP